MEPGPFISAATADVNSRFHEKRRVYTPASNSSGSNRVKTSLILLFSIPGLAV